MDGNKISAAFGAVITLGGCFVFLQAFMSGPISGVDFIAFIGSGSCLILGGGIVHNLDWGQEN